MPAAVSNRLRTGIVREVTPGTTPASPVFQTLRQTSNTLNGAPRTVESDELINDRMVADLILVGKEIAGDIGLELSVGSHDLLLEAALFNAWTKLAERTNTPNSGGISAVAATTYTVASASGTQPGSFAEGDVIVASGFTNSANNKTFVAGAGTTGTSVVHTGGVVETPPATARLKKIGVQATTADLDTDVTGGNHLNSAVLDFTTLGLVVGQWVKIGTALAAEATSFATAANNGYCRISAIAATQLTFDVVPSGFAADTGTGKTIRLVYGDYLRNGTTQYAHTLENAFLDNGQFAYFRGMVAQQLQLQLEPQAIIKGSVSFAGMDSELAGTTRVTGATDYVPLPAGREVLNSSSNVGQIAEDGTPVAGPNFVLQASINVVNNLRMQPGIGTIGATGIGAGTCQVTGSLNTYFGDADVLAKALANEATSLHFIVSDSEGNTYLIDLPRIKLATGTANVSGKDQDVVAECTYQAIKHPVLGYQIHIQKLEGVL